MNKYQTFGQIMGLTPAGFYMDVILKIRSSNQAVATKHTLPRDPLRSLTPPTLRLKGVSDTDHGGVCGRGVGVLCG